MFAVEMNTSIESFDEVRVTGYLENGRSSMIGRSKPAAHGHTVYLENPLDRKLLYPVKGMLEHPEHFKI